MTKYILLILIVTNLILVILWGYFTKWKFIFPVKNIGTNIQSQIIENKDNKIIENKDNKIIENKDNKITFNNLLKNIDKGLKPKTWGPPCWYTLHAMAFGYPDYPNKEEKFHAYNFFTALPFMIPCSKCGKHCKEYIINNPPDIDSKSSLSNWLVGFHNTVSKRLGNREIKIEILEEHFRDNNMCQGSV